MKMYIFLLGIVPEVKIAGKPVSTCRYPSDAALPISTDAERLVRARRNILYATEMRPWTFSKPLLRESSA